jgi:hypothetical protein
MKQATFHTHFNPHNLNVPIYAQNLMSKGICVEGCFRGRNVVSLQRKEVNQCWYE